MTASDIALPPGFRLQEYAIESTLGVGGFGLTYLATDTNLDLQVAIKEYLPSDLASRGSDQSVTPKPGEAAETFTWGRQRFLDESRTLASFRHPNIVRVMRFFEANSTAYMVMEFVNGRQLADWASARRPFSEAALLGILLPLLEGLEMIHAKSYLHRDIKPGNIFVREDDSPVLIDFGSARAFGPERGELTAIVTPGYAPLEQYHAHGKQGPWTDLYALGGVLYWLLTGSKPIEAAARVRNDPLPPAAQVGDRNLYSDALLTTIDWMLLPPEDQRPQSVSEVRSVFGSAAPPPRAPSANPAATQRVAPPAQPSSAPTSMPTALALDRDALKKVADDLAAQIGPISAVVIKNASRKALSLAGLVEIVAKEIEDEAERTKFIRRHAGGERSTPTGQPSRPSGPATQIATKLAAERFDMKVLAKAEAAIAQHIGPLARVVVKRAAMKARDEAELYLIIADEIEDKAERKAFVRKSLASA
jgi:serine/threonine protein kinase